MTGEARPNRSARHTAEIGKVRHGVTTAGR